MGIIFQHTNPPRQIQGGVTEFNGKAEVGGEHSIEGGPVGGPYEPVAMFNTKGQLVVYTVPQAFAESRGWQLTNGHIQVIDEEGKVLA